MRNSSRLLRGTAILFIAFVTLVGGGIVVFSMAVSATVPWEARYENLWVLPSLGLAVLLLGVIMAFVCSVSWRWIAAGALAPIALFAFLGFDESAVRMPDLGLRVGTDDLGYRTMMWLGKDSPTSRLDELTGFNADADQELKLPKDVASWPKYSQVHKDSIEHTWMEMVLLRKWVDNLAERPPQGVWRCYQSDTILDFRPVRRLCEVANAYAYGRAVEGETDDAIATLIPVIRAMHNLQRTSPGLLHSMIATVVLKQNYKVIEEVLNRGTPSARVRTALREAMEAAPAMTAVMHNVFGGEIEFVASVLDQTQRTHCALYVGVEADEHRWVNAVLFVLDPFVFHRNETLRLVSDLFLEAETMAIGRSQKVFENWSPRPGGLSQQVRNPLGRKIAAMIIPASAKTINQLWENEDRRVALLKRL